MQQFAQVYDNNKKGKIAVKMKNTFLTWTIACLIVNTLEQFHNKIGNMKSISRI